MTEFINSIMSSMFTETSRMMADSIINSYRLSRLKEQKSTHSATKNYSVSSGSAAAKAVKNYLLSNGYVYTKLSNLDLYWLASAPVTGESSVIAVHKSSFTIDVSAHGDPTEYRKVLDYVSVNYPQTGVVVRTATSISDNKRLRLKEDYLTPTKDNTAMQSFYPQLELSLSDYFDRFLATKDSVLLLIGPAGTGKSTFIRSLIMHSKSEAYIAYDNEVVSSPILAREFFSSNAKLLAAEDVDLYLTKRENGNTLMSTYLNAAEGIVGNAGKKVVLSTNLSSINKVDEALLRKGRCYDIITFGPMTVEQARCVEADMGLLPQDYQGKDSWTLSEVLNPPHHDLQATKRKTTPAGFTQT